jgi:hypothetical protein
LSLHGITSPSLPNHGGAGLVPIRGHVGAPLGPHELGVHDSGGAHVVRVPEDLASPVPMGGHVVSCAVFYGQAFGVPSHQFLCSLVQYYNLELHHMTPSGILHIATFVTLCEAYMEIEPHFDLWSHFYRVRLSQGVKAAIFGGADIYVKSGHGVDPYFHLPMSKSTGRSWKVWFFLRNDADAPLPMFTDSHPVPQPN